MDQITRLNLINGFEREVPIFFIGKKKAYYRAKRVMDLLISLCILIFLSPVFLIVAGLVILDSPGPIFFKQTRVGTILTGQGKALAWKKRNFTCVKFRTMYHNADQTPHQNYVQALIRNDQETMQHLEGENAKMHKLVSDPRITRVGKYLRKLSIDEIPQFWNVLRGDMSLVGPRPAIPYEVEQYSHWHLRRLQAKPGITGLQQVTARCTLSFDEQVLYDIQYTEKQNLWLDFKILIKTPIAVLIQKGV